MIKRKMEPGVEESWLVHEGVCSTERAPVDVFTGDAALLPFTRDTCHFGLCLPPAVAADNGSIRLGLSECD
jgi:hypothetical protein